MGGCVPEKYRFRLAYGLWAAASSSQFLNSSVSQCVGFCFACRLLRRHSPHFPRWSEKCSKKKNKKKVVRGSLHNARFCTSVRAEKAYLPSVF